MEHLKSTESWWLLFIIIITIWNNFNRWMMHSAQCNFLDVISQACINIHKHRIWKRPKTSLHHNRRHISDLRGILRQYLPPRWAANPSDSFHGKHFFLKKKKRRVLSFLTYRTNSSLHRSMLLNASNASETLSEGSAQHLVALVPRDCYSQDRY